MSSSSSQQQPQEQEEERLRRQNPPEWDLLLSAAQKNDFHRIERMITGEMNVNPSHSNGIGQSALHIASLWGHVDSVRVLIKCGANVHAQNTMSGGTPLHMVCQSQKGTIDDRMKVIDMLLDAGARLDKPDYYGILPIDCVQETDYRHDPTSKALLIDKLQPMKPMMFASIDDRNIHEMRIIMNKEGPEICFRHYKGITPGTHIVNDLVECIEQIHEYDKNDHNDNEQQEEEEETEQQQQQQHKVDSAIQLMKMYEELLKVGGERVLATNNDDINKTASSASASAPGVDPPIFRLTSLLRECYIHNSNHNNNRSKSDHDNNKEKEDNNNNHHHHQILLLSSELANLITNIVKMGRVGGVGTSNDDDDDIVTKETYSLFHQACRRNEIQLVKFFIERLDVDINKSGRQGITPLQFAARSGQITILQYLLQQPTINIYKCDDLQHNALHAATVNNKHDCIQVLQEYMKQHPEEEMK